MATIEPRLIHLLNNSTTPEISNVDLPPFHSLPLPDAADRPLPPLERDAGQRLNKSATESRLNTPQYLAGEEDSLPHLRADGSHTEGSYTGASEGIPTRLLRREHDTSEPPYSLPKILDDAPDSSLDNAAMKKRSRLLATGREDYLQLPQPLKKQKPTLPASAFPPIISGLHQPPPDAALFPPIASESFRQHNDSNELRHSKEQSPVSDGSSRKRALSDSEGGKQKVRKRATKPRRKWSEEETNHLLLGVSKHGVGKWTIILEDKAFTFNGRSAGDLKDRFRTCCPAELRGTKSDRQHTPPAKSHQKRPMKGLHSENILHEDDSPSSGMLTPPTEPDMPSKPKKTRAHRKKLEDLENLGIHAPFKKSVRRERRPFTEQDDREILDGLDKYGPAWTKIQRDSNFHLSSRQPTDLRDRVRNKYPQIYQRIEKGTYSGKESTRSNNVMEPLVNMSIGTSLKPSSQAHRAISREDMSRGPRQLTELLDRTAPNQTVDLDTGAPHWLGGEMGISRLLLDDSR